jgi:molybdopterin-containing oxidoreductase family membrane subunit
MTDANSLTAAVGEPSPITRIERDTLASMADTSGYYWLGLLGAVSLTALGGWALSQMLREGLGITGLNGTVMWGSLITSFVFFIGVSHSGTLVSAILFFTRSPLRAAVGRSAEAMTVIAILTAGVYPVIHLGRAWLAFFLLPYPNQRGLWPNVRSPLEWDVFAVCSYVTVSALFLYMGMLPDFALLSRRVRGWRRPLYRILSLGFSGTDGEWGLFEKAYPIFAAVVIPLAVSVHSVVSWDFAMTLSPGWHSAIFPPYFVAGAIFSGVAMAILLLGGLRRGYKLEHYIKPEHFDLLAKLMLSMSLVMTFVYATEFFMAFYRGSAAESEVFRWRATGTYAPVFWLVVLCNSVAPLAIFWRRVRRSLATLVVLSVLVTIGMWFERFMFIVTTLAHGYDSYAWRNYTPTPREVCICLGGFGMFVTLFLLFIKILPSMSIAETMQGEHAAGATTRGDPAHGHEVTRAT